MLTSAYVIAQLYLFSSHSEFSGTTELICFCILTLVNRHKMFTSHILSILLVPSHSSFTLPLYHGSLIFFWHCYLCSAKTAVLGLDFAI